MSAYGFEAGIPKHLTATGNVDGATNGTLIGFYVNTTSAGTLVLREGGSGGTALTGTMTPAIGYHAFPGVFTGLLHATIANTLDVTFFVKQGTY
jgi:hypothetical protein